MGAGEDGAELSDDSPVPELREAVRRPKNGRLALILVRKLPLGPDLGGGTDSVAVLGRRLCAEDEDVVLKDCIEPFCRGDFVSATFGEACAGIAGLWSGVTGLEVRPPSLATDGLD